MFRCGGVIPVPPGSGFIGTNVPYVLGRSGIPFVIAPTGSMANNGALTLGTALNLTYTGGLYLHLPASAIVAGSAAGWYWTVMSTTTAGTVFNSTYTTGAPSIGTTTAFATTGPGAFTGEVSEITAQQITVPAKSMGPNGWLRVQTIESINSTAGAKTLKGYLPAAGSTGFVNSGLTTGNLTSELTTFIANRGLTNSQVGSTFNRGTFQSNNAAIVGSIDTTAAMTFAFTLQKAVATDTIALEFFEIEVGYGA